MPENPFNRWSARERSARGFGSYDSRGSDRVAKIGTDLGGVDDADR